jgi:hypothetical protein
MTAIRDWFSGFDLGAFLDVGLDTRQIGHLAGSLFLALFGLSALRRVHLASGPLPALWISVSAGLIAGGISVFARGFPEQIPEDLRGFVDPDRLVRAAVVAGLFGCSIVFLSAHWVRGRWARGGWRLAGLAAAGLALWLAAAWFADQLPDEARPWAARPIVTRGLVVAGLLVLACSFWLRPAGETTARRWANRVLVPPTLALAVVVGTSWFGPAVDPGIPVREVTRIAVLAAAIATVTCAIIAGGAYCLRDRPKPKIRTRTSRIVDDTPIPLVGDSRPLPVAVLLDDQGRPVLPPSGLGRSGSGSGM